jgi:hypothetical protein
MVCLDYTLSTDNAQEGDYPYLGLAGKTLYSLNFCSDIK